MQPATAGSVVARNYAGGRGKMSAAEWTAFLLIFGMMAVIVIMLTDDDGGMA
jgi:hypothetical protein